MEIQKYNIKSLSRREVLLFDESICKNPYIPKNRKPYPRQSWSIFEVNKPLIDDEPNTVLVGAGGYGGKTILGSQLAAQHMDIPDYTCLVTRKNRKELKGTDSIWENLKDWLCDPSLGNLRCSKNETDLVIKAPNGAAIYFKPFDEEDSKQKVKSESYSRIINDEASELKPRVLKFIFRSLRNADDNPISPAMINLSNPGGPATDYLVEEFVDGPYPYFPLDWRHNPFINKKVYSKTLNKLDFIDIQYQKLGNWHYKPAKGDLFPEKILEDCRINTLPPVRIVRNIRGIDIAITKTGDWSAFVKWLQDERGHKYIADVVRIQTEYPEDTFCEVVEKDNPSWRTGSFNTDYYIEKGVAESGVLAKRLILGVLEDYIEQGLSVTFIPPVINKFTRARPMALDFKNNNISILNNPNIFGEDWIPDFITEYKDFGPDPKDYDHDDQVDGGSVGFNELNKPTNTISTGSKRNDFAEPKGFHERQKHKRGFHR
jgi:predicted phage terminase large subunit-like protein